MDESTKFWLMMIIIVFAAIAFSVIIREIVLWYWRVNHIVQKLESIDNSLQVISSKIGSMSSNVQETKDV